MAGYFDVLREEHEKNPDKASGWLEGRILQIAGKRVSPRVISDVLQVEKGGERTCRESGCN